MKWGLALAMVLGLAGMTAAEPSEDGPTRLTLRPMGPSVPALKHSLLPTMKDQRPGNAAVLYYRSFSPEWWVYNRKDVYENFEKWNAMPLAELLKDTQVVGLARSNQLREVDRAARRAYCDWELTERARQDGFALLLPDVQSMRTNGTMLRLRARVEIAEGRLDDAVQTMQTGFALGRHMGEAPILINDLVGLAIGHLMMNEVEEFISQPKAPNLYWSLTALPRPYISIQKALEGEKSFVIEAHFRPLAEKPMTPLTADQLQELQDTLFALAADGSRKPRSLFDRAALLALALKTYPEDKKLLTARGFEAGAVERLPILQVGFLASIHRYQAIMDDTIKWSNEPYYVSAPHFEGVDKHLKELKAAMADGVPIATLLVPAINKVNLAVARFDRRIAALRCIEALRLHAAANGGKLPATLDEVKAVPIPVDPLTSKPFEYKAEGTKATLKGVSALGVGNLAYAIDYELTFTR